MTDQEQIRRRLNAAQTTLAAHGYQVPILQSFLEAGSEALLSFKEELIRDRGRIENEDEPVFDVILDLLDRCIAETKRRSAER